METLKKVVAAIIGILIIVALILLAKWLGDRIRERIFPAKTETQTVAEVVQPNVV
jgi:flagellar biogenesis protein FliO